MRYQNIIWDWNGTLLDDVMLAINVVNEILRDHDKQALTHERYLEIFDFPVKHYYVPLAGSPY
jgi:phosphoglycolate phosphatase